MESVSEPPSLSLTVGALPATTRAVPFGSASREVGAFHTGTFLRSSQWIVERKGFPALSQVREVRAAEYAVVVHGRHVGDSDQNSTFCFDVL